MFRKKLNCGRFRRTGSWRFEVASVPEGARSWDDVEHKAAIPYDGVGIRRGVLNDLDRDVRIPRRVHLYDDASGARQGRCEG